MPRRWRPVGPTTSSSTWIICGGKVCFQSSKMSDQSVYLVGCSASNFAGAALTLRETTEVRRGLSWLSDKPKVPKRMHLGTLLAEFSADVFAITGMPEDSLARIGCRPVRTKEHSGVRREGPQGGKRGLRGRGMHRVSHVDVDRRDQREMAVHIVKLLSPSEAHRSTTKSGEYGHVCQAALHHTWNTILACWHTRSRLAITPSDTFSSAGFCMLCAGVSGAA